MDLKKYNEKLLAILGTLAVVGLATVLLGSLFFFIVEQFGRNNNQGREGVVVDQNQVVDTSTFSFSQQISVLEPYQLDTLQPIFLIPIGQKNQKSKINRTAAAGLNFDSKQYLSSDYAYSSFYGLYNNFVLIDYSKDLKTPIFDTKIAISEWAYLKIDSSKLILFKGTNRDLNKDGILNEDDFQSLFVFNVNTLEVRELTFENQTVQSFSPLKKTSKIYVRTGKDINGDGRFQFNVEPTDLYFYDAATGESETLVPDEIKSKIQKILN